MMLDAVFERFAAGAPMAVMAQLGFERVLDPSWLDDLFEEYRGRQYDNYATCADGGLADGPTTLEHHDRCSFTTSPRKSMVVPLALLGALLALRRRR